MRWFTKAWHRGDHVDPATASLEAERAYTAALQTAYRTHLAELSPDLPAALEPLVAFHRGEPGLNLHDGLVDAWSVDDDNLTLTLVCERVAAGVHETYVRATITYTGDVEMVGTAPEAIRAVLDDPTTEVLYDELDRAGDGRFEHRLLLWPYFELQIRFRDASLTEAPADASARGAQST